MTLTHDEFAQHCITLWLASNILNLTPKRKPHTSATATFYSINESVCCVERFVNLSSSKKQNRSCSTKLKKCQIVVIRQNTHKTFINKHKADIKTGQKHRYNTIPIFQFIVLWTLKPCYVRTFDAVLRNNLYRFFILCTSSSNFFIRSLQMSDAFHISSFFLNYSTLLYGGDRMQ